MAKLVLGMKRAAALPQERPHATSFCKGPTLTPRAAMPSMIHPVPSLPVPKIVTLRDGAAGARAQAGIRGAGAVLGPESTIGRTLGTRLAESIWNLGKWHTGAMKIDERWCGRIHAELRARAGRR